MGTGVVTGTKAVGSGQFANSISQVENLPEKNGVGVWMWTLSILVTGSLEARFNFYGALIGSHQLSSSSQDISSKNTKLRVFNGNQSWKKFPNLNKEVGGQGVSKTRD